MVLQVTCYRSGRSKLNLAFPWISMHVGEPASGLGICLTEKNTWCCFSMMCKLYICWITVVSHYGYDSSLAGSNFPPVRWCWWRNLSLAATALKLGNATAISKELWRPPGARPSLWAAVAVVWFWEAKLGVLYKFKGLVLQLLQDQQSNKPHGIDLRTGDKKEKFFVFCYCCCCCCSVDVSILSKFEFNFGLHWQVKCCTAQCCTGLPPCWEDKWCYSI